MDKETRRNIYLGLLVSIGLILLIISVYFIGSKKNLFSSNIQVYTVFRNVNGLQEGNNIRFLGIDIGTVKKISVIGSSTIVVMAVIEKKYIPFINKNAIASIGTDGLMGNKIIYLRNQVEESATINESDTLTAITPVETEEIVKTLSESSKNINVITHDLKKITGKIENSNSLWKLLSDSILTENIRQAVVNIKISGNNTALLSGDLKNLLADVKSGKGSLGVLLTDTILSHQINQTIVEVKVISDTLAMVSGDLKNITAKINRGEGAVGTLLMDTAFAYNLNESLENIRNGSKSFNENMEALKHSFLLRRYFKEKKEKKP